ncbi:ribosomal protein S27AE [Caldisphaera lagunensis DSM 15908]|uniref:Small ribosomal subunit protein eS31 n=1 Tax=Caldisphaera lagunensis (strain DSM 15908 / JCM 11604 / ANMR 0165 / IC-154) TaxID=1056495 RepID=L0A9A4_CALLD|nr:30S ribosomal protein S27ae [Caldisphaera lagunensis]AFZ70004.1 ribosomal protein S27AE [Caldisphaera lagunensis DSM 15908]
MAKEKPKAYIHTLYEVDYNNKSVSLKNKKCPRCGNIMAHHLKPVERYQCGYCKYTEFVVKK